MKIIFCACQKDCLAASGYKKIGFSCSHVYICEGNDCVNSSISILEIDNSDDSDLFWCTTSPTRKIYLFRKQISNTVFSTWKFFADYFLTRKIFLPHQISITVLSNRKIFSYTRLLIQLF